MELKHYKELSKVDTSKMTEKKNGLTYLTWSKAFDKLLEAFPEATYKILKFEGKPYFMDESGAMVFTEMTIEGITREMFLPVLDGANKPMKKESYKYTTRYGEKSCEAINMFDVNKALMRCLVKNMAVFGLGLNVYAGEDLPLGAEEGKTEYEQTIPAHAQAKPRMMGSGSGAKVYKRLEELKINPEQLEILYKKKVVDFTAKDSQDVLLKLSDPVKIAKLKAIKVESTVEEDLGIIEPPFKS